MRISIEQRRAITDLYERLEEHLGEISLNIASYNSLIEDLQGEMEAVALEMDAFLDRQPAQWLDTREGGLFDEWMCQWPGHGEPEVLDAINYEIEMPALSPEETSFTA